MTKQAWQREEPAKISELRLNPGVQLQGRALGYLLQYLYRAPVWCVQSGIDVRFAGWTFCINTKAPQRSTVLQVGEQWSRVQANESTSLGHLRPPPSATCRLWASKVSGTQTVCQCVRGEWVSQCTRGQSHEWQTRAQSRMPFWLRNVGPSSANPSHSG